MDAELIQPQEALFDYESLETEARIVIQQRASEIKTLAKRVAADIVEIGGKLAEVKDRLGGNGKFSAWLGGELGWSDRTAGNFIAVWQKFEGRNLALENFATSALYLLAAPSTPGEAVEAARQIADSGEKVTHATAKQLVERAKARRPKQAALVDPIEPEPAELPADAEVEATAFVQVEGEAEESAATLTAASCPPAAEGAEEPVLLVDGGGFSHHRPAQTPAPAAAAPAIERPATWYTERIEISIALMPCGGPGEERKVLFSVGAGDRIPYYAMGVGEIPSGELPAKVAELLDKLSAALATEPVKKPAKKTASPAAKRTAAKKPAAKKAAK